MFFSPLMATRNKIERTGAISPMNMTNRNSSTIVQIFILSHKALGKNDEEIVWVGGNRFTFQPGAITDEDIEVQGKTLNEFAVGL